MEQPDPNGYHSSPSGDEHRLLSLCRAEVASIVADVTIGA